MANALEAKAGQNPGGGDIPWIRNDEDAGAVVKSTEASCFFGVCEAHKCYAAGENDSTLPIVQYLNLVIRLFIALVLNAMLSMAQQTISVANAASFSGGIAPGSILGIQQLQPPRLIGPVNPNRVSVQVRPLGSTISLDAPLLSSPLLSIWAQLPASTPLGPADVILTVDGQASAPARVMVMRTSFGLFTQAGNGLGAAAAQNQDTGQSPSSNRLTNPALPGQFVVLWGTGLGAAAPSDVTIQLGGSDITPVYAGHAPGLTGVDQINFQIPENALDGCYVSVIVKAGDSVSNEATIATAASPGPCEHPFGLSAAELATLDSGGQILFGAVRLQSDVVAVSPLGSAASGPTRFEGAFAEFFSEDAFDIGLSAQPLAADDRYFGCSLVPPPAEIGLLLGGRADAGDTLTLTGPNQTATLSRVHPGFSLYQTPDNPLGKPLSDPPFFLPGIWRIQAPGGMDIEPSQTQLALPPLIHWTNRENLASMDRGRDQDVLWDPTGYNKKDVATVMLALTRLALAGSFQIACRAPARSGMLTIPSSLLEALPPFAPASLRLGVAPRPNLRTLFSLPLTNGSAAHGFFDYSFSETISTQTQ